MPLNDSANIKKESIGTPVLFDGKILISKCDDVSKEHNATSATWGSVKNVIILRFVNIFPIGEFLKICKKYH